MNRAIAPLMLTTVVTLPALAAPPPPQIAVRGSLHAPAQAGIAKTPTARTAKSVASAPDQFTIIDVQGAGTAANQGTAAIFVDSSGRATGYYVDSADNYHSFVRAPDGAITPFDIDGSDSQTIAHWANDKGAVTGDFFDSSVSQYQGFLRKANGKTKTFDGASSGTHYTVTVSINSKNAVIGWYYDDGDVPHGFLRDKSGAITQIDAPDAGNGSNQGTTPQDINTDGVTVGFYLDSSNLHHGFIRASDGTISEFDVAGAGTGPGQGTQGIGINNKGWITGDYFDSNSVVHGFVRDPGGNVTPFDAPDAGTGADQGTVPIEINNKGAATGWYLDLNNVYHGFVRAKNGTVTEFDAPGAGGGAYLGTSGYDISKYGVVAGYDQDDDGVYHGFLRTP